MSRPNHTTDADCIASGLDTDDSCIQCGVYHGDPCALCEGSGFHKFGCIESDAYAEDMTLHDEALALNVVTA